MPASVSLPDLSGTVVVVTGAAGNIGAGIARRFALAGAAVVAHFRTGQTSATELVEAIRAGGGRAIAVQADLRVPAACEQLLAEAVAGFGRVDTLVNNAGIQPVSRLADLTVEQWREVLDTNVTGSFLCTQAAVAVMGRHGGGSVIHIASIEGSHPARSHAHYSASKAALIMHARSAALEYASLGVRVNAVSPGLIGRPGLEEEWPDGVGRWQQAVPLGRLGDAADVGDACVFLASPMASWITGQNLVVDGGVSVHPTW